jgi:hypothetical protein
MRSDEFLQDYYKDCKEDMRGRRELEFRLVQILLIFCPIIVTGMTTVYSIILNQEVYLALSIGASVFILLVSALVTYRILVEHKAYANMGQIVQKIWTYFELFEPGAYLPDDSILPDDLRDPKKGFGQGRGHIRTLWIIWLVTSTMVALILTLGLSGRP